MNTKYIITGKLLTVVLVDIVCLYAVDEPTNYVHIKTLILKCIRKTIFVCGYNINNIIGV